MSERTATPPLPLPASGEGNGEKPVRIVSVAPDGGVHLLPLADATLHDLAAGCWCEPEAVVYVPEDAIPDERYDAWNHKSVC